MAASKQIVKIETGAGVAQETLDAMTRELLDNINEYCGEPVAALATEPTPEGAKAGVETAMIGALLLFGGEIQKKLIGKIADAIWEWLCAVKRRLSAPVRVTLETPNGVIEITSNLSKDDVLQQLRRWVESPE